MFYFVVIHERLKRLEGVWILFELIRVLLYWYNILGDVIMTSVTIANVILWSDFLPNVTVKHPNKQTLYWTGGGGGHLETRFTQVFRIPYIQGLIIDELKQTTPDVMNRGVFRGVLEGGQPPSEPMKSLDFRSQLVLSSPCKKSLSPLPPCTIS